MILVIRYRSKLGAFGKAGLVVGERLARVTV